MECSTFYKEMVDRNIGVLSEAEQLRLQRTCVAVAGCGGIGGLSAEQFVRLGVGHVKIADFDSFQVHNISRQCCSTASTVGKKKTEVLAKYFKEINPELRVDVFGNGVQPENAEEFVKDAEIIVDGIDYASFYNTVLLHRAARKKDLCIISPSAIGYGASVLAFGPKTITIEEYVGLTPASTRQEIETYKIPLDTFVPYIPSYIDVQAAKAVAAGVGNIPNIIMPQHLGTAMAVMEAILIILGKVPPPAGPKPRIFVLDLEDRKFQVTG